MPRINKQQPGRVGPARAGYSNVTDQGTGSTLAHARPGVLDRISPIGFNETDGLKVLLYGRSGTGKTTLWATFPKPILAVLCSGGSKPGELRSIDTPEYRNTVRQVVLEQSRELMDLSDSGEVRAYRTVVLDHATGLQDLVLKEILGVDELPAQKTWGLASQQQYGQCTLQCKELLRGLLGLTCNVVLVAQEREFNNEGDTDLIAPSVGPGLTPSLAGWLNQAVDYVVQTYLRQKEEVQKTKVGDKVLEARVKTRAVEYCLRTGPDPTYMTKFRVPRGTPLPDALVDADYGKMLALIRGRQQVASPR